MEKRHHNELISREESRLRNEEERNTEVSDAGCPHTDKMAEVVSF
jgi:hypothetical protein